MTRIWGSRSYLLFFFASLMAVAAGCSTADTNTPAAANKSVANRSAPPQNSTVQQPVNSSVPAQVTTNSNVTVQNSPVPAAPRQTSKAIVKAKDTKATAGREVTLEIELDSADDIAAVIFTLDFDPSVFTYVSSALSPNAPKEAVLTLNDKVTGTGKLGALMDSTTPFAKGKRTIMTVVFRVAAEAAARDYQFTFSSKPAIQSVSNIKADLVETNFMPGTVRVSRSR